MKHVQKFLEGTELICSLYSVVTCYKVKTYAVRFRFLVSL